MKRTISLVLLAVLCVGLLCACPAANHNDHVDFDEQALANGAAMFTAVTASLLA